MTSDVKVFQNLYDDVLHFETKEEFNRYYAKNKEAVDKMATRGLNVKFKINGFKIGRTKGEIILYPTKDTKQTPEINTNQADENGITIHQKLNSLNNKIKNIESLLTSVLDAIFNDENEHNTNSQYRAQTTNQTSTRFNTSYI